MDKLKELRDERETVEKAIREVQAITQGKDARSLTEEERTKFDDSQKRLKELDSEMDQVRADAARIAFDPSRKDDPENPPEQTRNEDLPPPTRNRIVVPAQARSHRPLKAYKYGDTAADNERDAYVAGHMFLARLKRSEKSAQWLVDHGFARTMNESLNPAGGFLVPDEMQRTLVRLREERGVFERFARNMPMGSDSMFVPRDLADVTAYWVAEGAEITASDASYGGAELVAKKLACLTKVSSELDEDAVIEVGDAVTASCAYAMADKIDDAGFNGDGTSTYGGVLGLKNALDSSATFTAAGDGFDELTLADGHDCIGKYPQYPGSDPAWYMHSAGYWAWAARLQFAGGGNTVSDLGNGPQLQWLGYPVRFTQVLTSTITAQTSTIIAFFGDLRLAATVGMRRNVNTMVSMDRYFENDLIGIKSTQRIAINVHERGDTIRNRPMIALKTAAS